VKIATLHRFSQLTADQNIEAHKDQAMRRLRRAAGAQREW
jgi:hypothetical protein